MLYHFLYPLHMTIPAFNVFRYVTFRTIYALLIALGIGLLLGPPLIRLLQRYRIGEQIRELGPRTHLRKSGTPTMGGLLILLSMVLSIILWVDLTNPYVWLVLLAAGGYGLIGFWDDYRKVTSQPSQGLTIAHKLLLQGAVSLTFAVVLYNITGFTTHLNLPFFKTVQLDLGIAYIPFAAFVVLATANAVNLTDGLDGLAIGPVIVAALSCMIFAYVAGHREFADYLLIPYVEGVGELAVVCGALIGASLAFLWYNAYPASVFMGDVGSQPIGAVVAAVALAAKHELLLVIVGGIFVIEAVSVIFQVVSYRSRGRRIFLMAPIHHHFELKGWEEPKIVVRFWIISIVLALLSLSTLKLR